MLILEQMRENVDEVFNVQQSMFISLAYGTHSSDIMFFPKQRQEEELLLKELSAEINSYCVRTQLINNAILYFPHIDKAVMSSGSITDGRNIHWMYFKNMEFSQWLEMINNDSKKMYCSLGESLIGGGKNERILLRQGIFLNDDLCAVLFVEINDKIMLSNVRGEMKSESELFVVDDNGDILITTSDKKQLEKIVKEMYESGAASREYEELVISSIPSKVVDWKFIVMTPKQEYISQLLYIRNIMLIACFLSLLIGVLYNVYLTRKNYLPVHDLIVQIERQFSKNFERGENEYAFIRRNISDLASEWKNIGKKLESRNQLLQNHLLYSVLKEKDKGKTVSEKDLKNANIEFNSDDFIVALFSVTDIQSLFEKNVSMRSEDVYEAYKKMVFNICENYIGKKYAAFTLEIDDAVCVLANVEWTGQQQGYEDIIADLEMCLKILKEQTDLSFHLAISDVNKGYEGIAKSYRQAETSLAYAKFVRQQGLVFYSDTPAKRAEHLYDFPLATEKRLINFICTGNSESALGIIEELFQKNMPEHADDIYRLRFLMMDIIGSILKSLSEHANIGHPNVIDFEVVESLLSMRDIDKIQVILNKIISDVCRLYASQEKKTSTYVRQKVTEYVENNYQKSELSLVEIADYIGITTSYLSRLYKEETGETVFKFIDRFRIEKAKEKIRQGLRTMEKIALECGYMDARALGRSFKRVEGILPSQYRNNIN